MWLSKVNFIGIKNTVNCIIFCLLTFNSTSLGQHDPRATPLDELINFHCNLCKDMKASEINSTKIMWNKCIDSFILQPTNTDAEEIDEVTEISQYYGVFCGNPNGFKKCWENITKLLNDCDPGRGDVSSKIYFTIYDNTCRNFGKDTIDNILNSSEHSELCELDYSTKICNGTRNDWYSKDICRRYESLKVCEESAIENCNNIIHQKVLKTNLHETGKSLGCVTNSSNKSTASSYALPRIFVNKILFVNLFLIVSSII